ncbi:MAG: glycine/sarcosine/betaine reductase component B subunit [Actinomycetota bacterium]|nr:glycine/sarcosine/betaine reductase component B subunit [Actinomycetota bacterium]
MAFELASFPADLLSDDRERINALAGDEAALAGVEVEVVRSGEPVRVTHVLDAVEPRIRPDGRAAFPLEGPAGTGRTNRLDGVAVLSSLDFPGEERPLHEQEAIVDFAGPGAEYTPFSSLTSVVLAFQPADGAGHVELDESARRVTLAVAELLAEPTLDAKPFDVERYELGDVDESLPALAAVIQLADLGQLFIQYLYGTPVGEAGLPRSFDPAELLDGAVTSGEYHWAALRNPTLFFQRNELVRALYREHGRRLRFAGLVLARGYEQSAADKEQAAERAAAAARELGADGVVITTDGGGNSHTDTMLTCRACEAAGLRTTVIVAEMADPESTNPGLTDWVPEADCLVSPGNAEEHVPEWEPERVIGGAASSSVPVRNYLGATNQMGQLTLQAVAL